MTAAFSMDFRRRVYEACQNKETTAEIAERFSVSEAFVRKLMQHHRENGFLEIPESGQKRGRKLALIKEFLERFRQLVTHIPIFARVSYGISLAFRSVK